MSIRVRLSDVLTVTAREKLIWAMMGGLLTYTVIRGVVAAAAKNLWYDELLTLAIVAQPTIHGMWNAVSSAFDGQPPPFYLIERAALKLAPTEEVALRLPSILGMTCTVACVFVYIKRWKSSWLAFLGATLFLSTGLYRGFVAEARPYSLMAACIALALISYQRLLSPLWATLLGLFLALAQCLHYYAIFVTAAFGLAESIRLLRSRQVRWQFWIALAVGVVPLYLFWPLLLRIKAFSGAHFWSHLAAAELPKTYGSLLWTSTDYGMGVAAICFAGVVGPYLWRFFTGSGSVWAEATADELAQDALVIGLLGLPILVFAASRVAHVGIALRYVLPTVLGVILALARIFSRASTKTATLFSIFVFAVVGISELSFWRSVPRHPAQAPDVRLEEMVQKAGRPELLVVVSDGLTYVQLAHYASPLSKQRLVYLADPERVIENVGADTLEKGILALRQYMPLQVRDFSEFVRSHHEFLLYVEDPGYGFDWLPAYFTREAASVKVLAIEGNQKLYMVTLKQEGS